MDKISQLFRCKHVMLGTRPFALASLFVSMPVLLASPGHAAQDAVTFFDGGISLPNDGAFWWNRIVKVGDHFSLQEISDVLGGYSVEIVGHCADFCIKANIGAGDLFIDVGDDERIQQIMYRGADGRDGSGVATGALFAPLAARAKVWCDRQFAVHCTSPNVEGVFYLFDEERCPFPPFDNGVKVPKCAVINGFWIKGSNEETITAEAPDFDPEKLSEPSPQGKELAAKGNELLRAAQNDEDVHSAVTYLKQAADLGDGSAMYGLGELYDKGEVVPQDLAVAFEWYKKAGYAGDGFGFEAIGRMYFEGRGVQEDAIRAYRYFKLTQQTGVGSDWLTGAGGGL